jgi:multidrug transporter EmrE-like cation transporter
VSRVKVWRAAGVPVLVRPRAVAPSAALGGRHLIGVFGTLVPFLLFSWGTARIGAQTGAVSISLEPLFGAVLAWAWLGQRLNAVQLAGAAVLLTAVIHLQRAGQPAGPVRLQGLLHQLGGRAVLVDVAASGDVARLQGVDVQVLQGRPDCRGGLIAQAAACGVGMVAAAG